MERVGSVGVFMIGIKLLRWCGLVCVGFVVGILCECFGFFGMFMFSVINDCLWWLWLKIVGW